MKRVTLVIGVFLTALIGGALGAQEAGKKVFASADASMEGGSENKLAQASQCTNVAEKDFTSVVKSSVADEEVLVVGCGGVF